MDAIERLSDSVAALAGRDLTLEECHQFILDAATILAPAHPVITGGGGTEVRWRLGERTLVISGGPSPETNLVSVSFFDTERVEDEECRDFTWGLIRDAPFHWAIVLGPEDPEDAWAKRCGCLCYNWDFFDAVFDDLFRELPHALAAIPPAWRPQVVYQWDMSVTSLGVVTVRATVDGVTISSDLTGDSVPLPPGFETGIGSVLAGLAAGAPLSAVPFLESRGLSVGPTTLSGRETPELLEQISWMERHNWDGFAPDTERNRRPVLTFDQLREAAAQATAEPETRPRPRTTREAPVAARMGLNLEQLQWIVQQWMNGAPVADVLMRGLGGAAGTYLGKQAIVGTDWVAYQPDHDGEWAIVVSPAEGESWPDDQQLAATAWQLCGALSASVGAPIAGRTSSIFDYARFFRAGERALHVDTLTGLRLILGSFEEMKDFHLRG